MTRAETAQAQRLRESEAMIRDLLRPEAFPHLCDSISLVETHISWVILTGPYAYKLKKPVRLDFLDFSTPEQRKSDCESELTCNRAFAPELYRAVVAVRRRVDGTCHVGSDGEVVDHAVKMVQFDSADEADRLLADGALSLEEIYRFGRDCAEMHDRAMRHAGTDAAAKAWAFVADALQSLDGMGHLPRADAPVSIAFSRTYERHRALLERREAQGFVRECHGDLHLANVVRLAEGLRPFDCLEFDADLRRTDTIADVAFFFMDCAVRGRDDLAYAFMDGYLEGSGDFEGAVLLPFFAGYRALVRARVAAIRLAQGGAEPAPGIGEHIDWATRRVTAGTGAIIVTCGLSGSGKSWLASRLLGAVRAIRIRSDVLRRVGRDDVEVAAPNAGAYTSTRRDAVYREMARLAVLLAASGQNVIVDATFLSRRRRQEMRRTASEIGAKTLVLFCTAPSAVLEQRVRDRDNDPSDATIEVLDAQRKSAELPEADERPIVVDTSDEADVASAAARLLEAIAGKA